MSQPTREPIVDKTTVEDFLVDTDDGGFTNFAYRDFTRILAKSYLALREEVDALRSDQEKIGKYIAGLCEQDFQKTKRVESLKAENQSLRARLGNNILEA